MRYYDRPYYLHCIVDISGTKPVDREPIIEYLKKTYDATEIVSPAEFAVECTKEMAKRGHPHLASLPTRFTNDECIELFTKCVKKINETPNFRTTPVAGRIQKDIRTTEELKTIVESLLLQQDGITITHIFSLADKPKIGFITSESPLTGRVARNCVVMSKEPIGKKKMEERLALLSQEISDAVEMSVSIEESLKTEAKYRR
jgi:hypothetical protein